MDLKSFASAIAQIAEEKGIPYEKVIEVIEIAIAAAYKKDYGKKGQIIKAKLDSESGEVKFWQVKQVLDESMIYSEEELEELKKKSVSSEDLEMSHKEEADQEEKKIRFNPEKHIMAEEAKKINPEIKAGEDLETILEMKGDYGRIAAQTAKQVILQKIREAEREVIFNEYKLKEGEIISGIVQRVEQRSAFLDIGKTIGILPREEQVPGEFYRPGQRLKVYVLKVEENPKGPVVFLSRAYPKIVSKLFELEVPEVSAGSVAIQSIAREAGSRSKVAVTSKADGVDPIGSMVGQRGTRVAAVINELGGEKIDIIEWSEEPEKFIANSLSPAKVLEVKILPKNKALVIVPEDQLSLTIGKDGQNVRLAAKLTGWKIDVRGFEEKKAAETKEIKGAKEEKKEAVEGKETKEVRAAKEVKEEKKEAVESEEAEEAKEVKEDKEAKEEKPAVKEKKKEKVETEEKPKKEVKEKEIKKSSKRKAK